MELSEIKEIAKNRHIWEEDSTKHSVAGDFYDQVCGALDGALLIVAHLEAEDERLRELMSEASLDDWFCQDNEEWMAKWRKALRGEQ